MSSVDLDILLVQLQDGRELVRQEAARALSRRPDPLARKNLLRCLKDSSADVRYFSLQALESLVDATILQEIVDLFQDSSRIVRLEAVRIASKHPSPVTFHPLVEVLADKDADVRTQAAQGLSQFPDSFIPRLMEEFSSKRWMRRNQIFQAVLMMGERVIPHLESSLNAKNTESEKLFWLIRLVGEFRLPALLEKIASKVSGFEDESLLCIWFETIVRLNDIKSIPLLMDYLSSSSVRVRQAAIQALSGFGEYAVSRLVDRLGDESRLTRLGSTEALSRIGEVSVVPLLESFYQKDKEGRFWVLSALRQLRPPSARSIFQALCLDEDADVQILSIASLGDFPADGETLDVLLELLDHPRWKVRHETASSLGRMEGVLADFLIRQLEEGSENRKYWMIKIMQEKKNKEFFLPLVKIFSTSEWILKVAACDALREIEKPDDLVLEILEKGDESLLYWLTRALEGNSQKVYAAVMVKFLDHGVLGIRENARKWFLSSKAAGIPALRNVFREKHPRSVYQTAAELISSMGSSSMEVLVELLSSESEEEIYWGSFLAGRLGETALLKIHELLQSPDWKVRSNAIYAVEQVRSPLSVEPLKELLEDEYLTIRKMAIRALSRLDHQRKTLAQILKIQGNESLELRLEIFGALVCLGSEEELMQIEKEFLSGSWLIRKKILSSIRESPRKEHGDLLIQLFSHIPLEMQEDFFRAACLCRNEKLQQWLAEQLDLLVDSSSAKVDGIKYKNTGFAVLILEALGRSGNLKFCQRIRNGLLSSDWDVRRACIDACREIKDPQSIPELRRFLQGADPVLKAHAKEAMKVILGDEVWEKMLSQFTLGARQKESLKFYQEAVSFLEKKEQSRALLAINRALALYEEIRYLNLKARILTDLKEYEQARSCFLRVIQIHPENSRARFNMAMLCYVQGDYERTRSMFARILQEENLDSAIREMIEKVEIRMVVRSNE